MPAHAFDVVIAANVLHATSDLGVTLERVKSLLASGGVLLAYEVTEHLPWFDITVGLIEGWQKHADDLRREHPLLQPDEWTRVLGEHGFDAVEIFPRPGSPAEILGHHVLLARGPRTDGASATVAVPAEDVLQRSRRPAEPRTEEEAESLPARLAIMTASERSEALVDFVRRQVVDVLRLDPSQPPRRTQRLLDMGFDSLLAIELAQRLASGLGRERPLPSTLIFEHPTIQAIAKYIEPLVAGLTGEDEKKTASDDPAGRVAALSQKLDGLTDEQLEELLLAKLKEIK